MKNLKFYFLIFPLFLLTILSSCAEKEKAEDAYLLPFTEEKTDKWGFKNQAGEIIIPATQYDHCFSDTFKTYALVVKSNKFVAIDRKEKVMYTVFPFDNGPDYASEGLFRIIENGKVGFADEKTGEIKIKPQFACAEPFENGTSKVSFQCKIVKDGEHEICESDNWFCVDKNGKKVEAE
ncbi:MAG: WG repeat-containing protein [Bacteroidota bacterium]